MPAEILHSEVIVECQGDLTDSPRHICHLWWCQIHSGRALHLAGDHVPHGTWPAWTVGSLSAPHTTYPLWPHCSRPTCQFCNARSHWDSSSFVIIHWLHNMLHVRISVNHVANPSLDCQADVCRGLPKHPADHFVRLAPCQVVAPYRHPVEQIQRDQVSLWNSASLTHFHAVLLWCCLLSRSKLHSGKDYISDITGPWPSCCKDNLGMATSTGSMNRNFSWPSGVPQLNMPWKYSWYLKSVSFSPKRWSWTALPNGKEDLVCSIWKDQLRQSTSFPCNRTPCWPALYIYIYGSLHHWTTFFNLKAENYKPCFDVSGLETWKCGWILASLHDKWMIITHSTIRFPLRCSSILCSAFSFHSGSWTISARYVLSTKKSTSAFTATRNMTVKASIPGKFGSNESQSDLHLTLCKCITRFCVEISL